MKNNHLFYILLCVFTLSGLISCEKAEILKSSVKDDKTITLRTDDCDDCPVNDCCCEIVVTSGSVTLEICGTTGNRLSTNSCGPVTNPPGSCNPVPSTYYLGPIILGMGGSQIFCVPVNSTIMFNVTSGNANVDITCQKGQSTPQTVSTSFSLGNRYFFGTDGDCVIGPCQ